MAAREFYFVRHGETDMNREFRCQGRIDISLNATGREQAQAAAREMAGLHIDRLYASPLKRAIESAAGIAASHGLATETLEWLLEIDHGAIEGLNKEEAEAVSPGIMDAWHNQPETVNFPGGENLEQVCDRVARGMLETYERDGGTIVFVTHQIVTGAARCIIEGRPLPDVWKDKLLNGKYYRAELTPAAVERIAARAARKA